MASADFSEVVVALILRHVPQKQRLQHCALVNKLWSAAACAATQSLALVLKDDNSNANVIDWINSHGRSLTSLQLGHTRYSSLPANVQQQLSLLPCPGLESLDLCNISILLQLSVNRSQLLLLSAATALTRLVLTDVKLAAATGDSNSSAALPTDNLMALSALTALQHLEVDSRVGPPSAFAERSGLLRLPSALVPCLTQVKHLMLHDAVTEVWALQQLSCLTRLCSLGVGLSWGGIHNTLDIDLATAAVAAALQRLGGLTSLSLSGSDPSLFVNPVIGQSCFSAFTQLHSLQLHSSVLAIVERSVDTAQLTHMTDLQHLDISLQSALSQVNALELLSWLSLQQLTYLRLSGVLKFDSLAPAPAYAALTASSNLQHLDLSDCILRSINSMSISSPWVHVFAPGKLLLQLTSLQLNGCQPGLGVRSLHCLVRCCPALQRLDLSTVDMQCQGFYEGKELSFLMGFKQLTSLTIRGYSRVKTVQILAQMTQMRELHVTLPVWSTVVQPGWVGWQPLLPLTRLCRLESLVVQDGSQPKLELRSTKPEGCPPDVWSQLRDLVKGGRAFESWLEMLLKAGGAMYNIMDLLHFMVSIGLAVSLCAFLVWGTPFAFMSWLGFEVEDHIGWVSFMTFLFAMKLVGRWMERYR